MYNVYNAVRGYEVLGPSSCPLPFRRRSDKSETKSANDCVRMRWF